MFRISNVATGALVYGSANNLCPEEIIYITPEDNVLESEMIVPSNEVNSPLNIYTLDHMTFSANQVEKEKRPLNFILTLRNQIKIFILIQL